MESGTPSGPPAARGRVTPSTDPDFVGTGIGDPTASTANGLSHVISRTGLRRCLLVPLLLFRPANHHERAIARRHLGSPYRFSMSPRSSEHRRPAVLPGLRLTTRDRGVLRAIGRYGTLTSDHVAALLFAGVSPRVARERLRRLWLHHYLTRTFLRHAVTDGDAAVRPRPIYGLGKEGARVVGAAPAAVSATTAVHDLIAIDLLIACEVAARGSNAAITATTERELAAMVKAARPATRPFVLPDGALTLSGEDGPMSFALEIVRADFASGTRRFIAKLGRYLLANRRRELETVFGFQRTRAVLIATPTQTRADNLRRAASRLGRGRAMLWFGVIPPARTRALPAQTFTAVDAIRATWMDAAGGGPHAIVTPTT